jgi:electron transfer flavoprotein alpha subunit
MLARTESELAEYRNVWVVAELRPGTVKELTFELLGAGRRLADARGGELWCVLLGERVCDLAADCFHRRADAVLAVEDARLASFVDATYANVLSRLIGKYKPEIVLCGATARGRALIPRVAVQTCAGLTADCTGLDIEDGTGLLLQTRPAFGGNIFATIKCARHRPQMATVRPRVMSPADADTARTGRLIREELHRGDVSAAARVLKAVSEASAGPRLADANFIVTGGRGVGGRKGFELLREFADLVGGAVGASRAAVDAGWIDYAHQVGQTGQTVQPRTYLACGVSGQIQHLVGMQSSDVIVAINRDGDAPMMKLADYAIVGDLFEVLPAMMAEIRRL